MRHPPRVKDPSPRRNSPRPKSDTSRPPSRDGAHKALPPSPSDAPSAPWAAKLTPFFPRGQSRWPGAGLCLPFRENTCYPSLPHPPMKPKVPVLSILHAVLLGGVTGSAHDDPSTETTFLLEETVVLGKRADLTGSVPSASLGSASGSELRSRPVLRRGEVLEVVPGMVVTQHAGGGKANQYFLRGFNLDHGTDFSISVDGMPLNMRTHAHGQGYADLNGVIPELIQAVDYTKGTYDAQNGDLSSAGGANFRLYTALPKAFASVEYGAYQYLRGVAGETFDIGTGGKNGKLTFAGEYNYYEGPWSLPEYFNRANGFARYFAGTDEDHVSLTWMGYGGRWQSSDQVPVSAVRSGLIGRFGNLDPTNGGKSERYSLQLGVRKDAGDTVTRMNLYGVYYGLDLFSNFTYFLTNPGTGDQFEQSEKRVILGGDVSRSWEGVHFLGKHTTLTLGLQTRTDLIRDIGLYATRAQRRTGTTRVDDVNQSSIGLFSEATVKWTPWFRTVAGLRADLMFFHAASAIAANTEDKTAGIVSPKLSAIFGPFYKTEFYANFGTGFHSNDARGVVARADAADPFARTMGGELGIRTQAVSKLTASAALWWLKSDSELVYVGDAGTNEAGPKSQRHGIEINAYWSPCSFFSLDAEWSLTTARLVDNPAGKQIPNSVPWMLSGGFVLGAQSDSPGWFSGTRIRAFSPRPLTENNSVKSRTLATLNTSLGYRTKKWEAAIECLNLLDRRDNDIEYFYESRRTPASAAFEERHVHPVEPRMVRGRFTLRW